MAVLFTHKIIFYCLVSSLDFYKGIAATKQPKSNIQRLRNDLLKDYDKNSRPVMDISNATAVELGLKPLYLDDLDEEKQILRMETWIRLTWTDHHLTWEPHHYGDIYLAHFTTNEIWLPDIYIDSNIPATGIHPKLDTNAICFPDGTVIWIPPVTINSYCKLDYTDYPNDVQKCTIKFSSWTHHGFAINLTATSDTPFELQDNTNPHWEVTDSKMERIVSHFIIRRNNSEDVLRQSIYLNANFSLRRRSYFSSQKVIWGPSLIAVLLTLTMFWLPSHSVQKLTLGCTSLFMLVALLLYIGESSSTSLPVIISAHSVHSLMYAVTSAMILEAVVINLGRIVGPHRPPASFMQILSGNLARVLLIFAPAKNSRLVDNQEQVVQTSLENYEQEWLCVSTAIDRASFCIYLLVFIIERNLSGV